MRYTGKKGKRDVIYKGKKNTVLALTQGALLQASPLSCTDDCYVVTT